jgi:hypothetical protein
MLITATILLIFFGVTAFSMLVKFLFTSLNLAELFLMITSAIITSLSAGVIWGGLFQ